MLVELQTRVAEENRNWIGGWVTQLKRELCCVNVSGGKEGM